MMRGEENEYEWSESDVEASPFARQLTITKAKKLICHHTKKFETKGHKGSPSKQKEELLPSLPMDPGFESDSLSDSSPFSEDIQGVIHNSS